jgi:hypothetical protein
MSRFEQAVEIAQGWPADKTVPKRLRAAYDQAQGDDKWQIGMLSEALMVASEGEADLDLVNKYWA